MGLLARTWARRGQRTRGRNLKTVEPAPAQIERRFEELVPGRSFVDVGCMWKIHGRQCFAAENMGAAAVTGFDGMPPTPEFIEEHRRRDSKVRFIQGDLHDPVSVERVGLHDIVNCSGVIYHTPKPFEQIEHLRHMTGEWLFLGSHTIPELPGFEQACIFYPGQSERQMEVFRPIHEGVDLPALTVPFDATPDNGYANMWWGLTPSAIEAMLNHAGFEVTERLQTPQDPFNSWFIARKTPGDTPMPPPARNRENADKAIADGMFPDFR